MSLERIYKHQISHDLELENVKSFVTFIEKLTGEEMPFAVLQKTTGTDVGPRVIAHEYRNGRRPIIAYGGKETFPLLSDPDEIIPGALAILDRQLIYSPTANPVRLMKDQYIWRNSLTQYYTLGTFNDIVKTFVDQGYPILSSLDLVDYHRENPFTINGTLALEDIFKENRINS